MINNLKEYEGFTLIEVLISIAIISIVATSIIGLFTRTLQNNNESKVLMESTILAKNIMEDVKKELDLLPTKDRDFNTLVNKAIEIQELYDNSSISISPKDYININKRLYIIKVEVPGVKEGSVERFVSQIYLP